MSLKYAVWKAISEELLKPLGDAYTRFITPLKYETLRKSIVDGGSGQDVRIPGRMPGACVRHAFVPVLPCHVQPSESQSSTAEVARTSLPDPLLLYHSQAYS